MEYKLKNEAGETFFTNNAKTEVVKSSQYYSEYTDDCLDFDEQNFKIGNFNISFYGKTSYLHKYSNGTGYGRDYEPPYDYRRNEEFLGKGITVESNGKIIFDFISKSSNVKLEDVLEGIVAYCYARKNSVYQVSNGKSKKEIKKLSLEELSKIEEKSSELENVFKNGLQDVLDGKQVDFQELLDKNFGKGACDLKQETQKCIDNEFFRHNQERLEAEKQAQARAKKEERIENFKQALLKMTVPVRAIATGLRKLKDSIVDGVCHLAHQAKTAKENREQKKQILSAIEDAGRRIEERDI